ncbi:MAG: hypothetical protein ACRDC6_29780 [Shewanella sp.]
MRVNKGDKVKCISHAYRSNSFLTAGFEYEVTAGFGDTNMYGKKMREGAFQIKGNDGAEMFCLLDGCGHGEWELVK